MNILQKQSSKINDDLDHVSFDNSNTSNNNSNFDLNNINIRKDENDHKMNYQLKNNEKEEDDLQKLVYFCFYFLNLIFICPTILKFQFIFC
jgi:hypothetical protein